MKVLIEDLFEISKATSKNVTMNFMKVDIVATVKTGRTGMRSEDQRGGSGFPVEIFRKRKWYSYWTARKPIVSLKT